MQDSDGLLVLCGSVNEITVKQLAYAREHGFPSERLKNEQKLNPEYRTSEAGEAFLDQLYEKLLWNGPVSGRYVRLRQMRESALAYAERMPSDQQSGTIRNRGYSGDGSQPV